MVLSNAKANATFSAGKSKGNMLLEDLAKNTGISTTISHYGKMSSKFPAFPSQTHSAASDSEISPCSPYLCSQDMEETSKALSFQSFISGDSATLSFPHFSHR